MGYELFNEPIGDNFKNLYDKLEPTYIRVAKAIREVDKNHIVMLDGASYGTDFSMFSDFTFDDKLVYACHDYTGKSATLDNFVAFRKKSGKPMIMTEYGHAPWEYLTTLAKRYKENNIGYTIWPYKMIATSSSFVGIQWPKDWAKIIEFQKAPRATTQEIEEAKAKCGTEVAKKAMEEYLELIKLENCDIYAGFINSLGL